MGYRIRARTAGEEGIRTVCGLCGEFGKHWQHEGFGLAGTRTGRDRKAEAIAHRQLHGLGLVGVRGVVQERRQSTHFASQAAQKGEDRRVQV